MFASVRHIPIPLLRFGTRVATLRFAVVLRACLRAARFGPVRAFLPEAFARTGFRFAVVLRAGLRFAVFFLVAFLRAACFFRIRGLPQEFNPWA